jgi:hypothetical protein
MKKQLFLCLTAACFFGICSVVSAEDTNDKTTTKTKETTRNPRKNKNRRPDDGVDMIIRDKYSKELAETWKLRRKDPEAFKTKSKELNEKIRNEVKAEREKFRKMVMEYRKTKDPKTREAISEYVKKAYERRIDIEAKRIAVMKERLEKAEKRLEEIKSKKDERINKRLKIILRDPKLSW